MYKDIYISWRKTTVRSGQAISNAREMGIEKTHRDAFHVSLGAGGCLLALTWYKTLTGKDIFEDNFSGFDVSVTEEARKIGISVINLMREKNL